MENNVLRYDEQAIMRLRALYRQYGYTQYRMSRFEEYSLYSENKAFLASGDIVTFTSLGGKLMALRPDVTLSIVKNAKDDGTLKKLYYNENVYRPGGYEYKEQMQVGLECIGDIDIYSMSEVVLLAYRSLETLGGHTCIDISHMGYINCLLESVKLAPAQKKEILRRVSEKNVPGLNALSDEYGLDDDFRASITRIAALYGPYSETIDELRSLSAGEESDAALREIETIHSVLKQFEAHRGVNLDFSIVNDLSYYSGLIFQGYIEGVPTKVLSGGRYDKLLRKFGKRAGAVGFAVFLDLLERLDPPRNGAEVDVMLLYGGETSPEELAAAVNSLTESGQSVRVQRERPGGVKYKKLIEM